MFEQRELSDPFILLNFLVFFKWNDGGSTKGHKKTEKEGGKLIFYSILCICWMEDLYVMSYLVAAVAVRCTYVASSKHVLLFSKSIFSPRNDFSEILIKEKQIILFLDTRRKQWTNQRRTRSRKVSQIQLPIQNVDDDGSKSRIFYR